MYYYVKAFHFYFKHVLCVCQWGAILLLRRAPLISISVLLTYFLRDTIAIDKGNFVIPHLGTLSPLFCKCFRSKRSNQLILKNILLTEISFYVELIKLNISSRCIEFHQIKMRIVQTSKKANEIKHFLLETLKGCFPEKIYFSVSKVIPKGD